MEKKVVVHIDQDTRRSNLFSAITTLVSLVVIGLLAYAVWFVLAKVMPILGAGYMAFLAFLEFRNLLATRKWEQKSKSLQQEIDDFAASIAGEVRKNDAESNVTQEHAKGLAYFLIAATVLVVLAHYAISTLLIYGYGTRFSGHTIALLGMVLTLVYALRTLGFLRSVFRVIKDFRAEPPQKNKVAFRLGVYWSKTRSLLVLIFVLGILAASFGFYLF